MLLISGRIHQGDRKILANAYNIANSDKYIDLVHDLLTKSP